MDPILLATTVTAFLAPYLAKMGGKAAEAMGEQLPEAGGKIWSAIVEKFKGKQAAEGAAKELAAKPDDRDNQDAFEVQLRKALKEDPGFSVVIQKLAEAAERETRAAIISTGSGAVATSHSVAAGEGGVAVKGDVKGSILVSGSSKIN